MYKYIIAILKILKKCDTKIFKSLKHGGSWIRQSA